MDSLKLCVSFEVLLWMSFLSFSPDYEDDSDRQWIPMTLASLFTLIGKNWPFLSHSLFSCSQGHRVPCASSTMLVKLPLPMGAPRWQLCCGDDLCKLTGISGGPAWTRGKGAPWGCWRKCYFNFKGTFCALISLGKQNAGHRMQLRNQMGDWQFGSEQVHTDPAAWCEPGSCSALRWEGGGGGGNIHPVCVALN